MPIVWRQEMSVGNALIDDEHKQLICLINSIEIALKAENHLSMIIFIVEQLEEYTHTHFVAEEKLMLKLEYAGYMDHKLAHQKILDKIVALKNRLTIIAESESNYDVNELVVDHADTTTNLEPDVEQMPADDNPDDTAVGWIESSNSNAELTDSIEHTEPEASLESNDFSGDPDTLATDVAHPKDSISAIEADVATVLRSWIIDHVLTEDMKLKPIFQKHRL